MQPLFLLSGLLCDETIWADVPRRLGDGWRSTQTCSAAFRKPEFSQADEDVNCGLTG